MWGGWRTAVKQTTGFELAAALVSLFGEPVPHDPEQDAEAAALREKLPDDRSALLKAAELCGEPKTPGSFTSARRYSVGSGGSMTKKQ